ncbi:MAG TPA: hypothetical protein VGU66_08810 [Candidatus Elarobacter sp.]|nr:hypothetical protein [Candidatus Elarobacter sp.]
MKDTFCAAASAQMVLSSLGVMNPTGQFELNGAATGVPGPLEMGNPLGLACSLDRYAPTGTFVVTSAPMPDAASANIVDALYELDVAVPVLVVGCTHWVVVHGVDTDVMPADGQPYQIEAFWFHDPADPPLIPPTGPEQHAPIQEWLSTYLTGCGEFCEPFIIVAGPVTAAAGVSEPIRFAQSDSSADLIDPADAVESAARGLEAFGLLRYGLAEDDCYEAQPPRLVQRIDRVDEFFYLVPLRRKDATFTVVRVDALLGTYLGAQFGRPDFRYADREQMRFELEGVSIRADGLSSKMRRGTFEVQRILVWRPSLETPSPYHPLYQVNVGGKTVFADVDGHIHRKFTIM